MNMACPLSFLCKDREEKIRDKAYINKDRSVSVKNKMYRQEVSHGMG